jgi:hypothetical protein
MNKRIFTIPVHSLSKEDAMKSLSDWMADYRYEDINWDENTDPISSNIPILKRKDRREKLERILYDNL